MENKGEKSKYKIKIKVLIKGTAMEQDKKLKNKKAYTDRVSWWLRW